MGFYDLPMATWVTISVLVLLYVFAWGFSIPLVAKKVRALKETHPRIRNDGCLWILVLFAAFFVTFPVALALFLGGFGYLIYGPAKWVAKNLCLGEGRTCCGIDLRRKPKTATDPEQGVGAGDGVGVGATTTRPVHVIRVPEPSYTNRGPLSAPSSTLGAIVDSRQPARGEEMELPTYSEATAGATKT